MTRAWVCMILPWCIASSMAYSQQVAPASSEKAPSLRVQQTLLERASFPVVDVHTHFLIKGRHDPELLDRYVQWMDRNGIALCVSLDGQIPGKLEEHIRFLSRHRQRFLVFANLDFIGTGSLDRPETLACNASGFVRDMVERLQAEASRGTISGLKFFKDFGLRYRNADGSPIAIDDPRWDPIWECCARNGLPVIMHTADPSAFFRPADENNERSGELKARPEWSFAGPEFPSRQSLHEARNRVIARHPKTTFIAAHFGNDAEDLQQLSLWLEEYPNLNVEFSSRLNELGRQPYSARAFFEKYQDRIMLGTDGPFPEERLRIYWRFLETFDEYFPYSEKSPPPQGDWRIYGLGLPPEILKKVYHANAARMIPGVADRLAAFSSSSPSK
jgi:predicted TIM-barrel fold metal-dependent hydrolase